jgi:hypothetical protein
MPKLHLEFAMDNAAFEGDPSHETAKILFALARRIEGQGIDSIVSTTRGSYQHPLRDTNGNYVGFCEVKE